MIDESQSIALKHVQFCVGQICEEPVCKFLACLELHALVRELSSSTFYWVCAYANNQHCVEEDIKTNPRSTSFYRAMQMSEGVLLVLDSAPAKRVAGEPKPPHNMKVKSIPADGNCLFEALAQSLGGKTARNVRASVVTHLTKHQGRYKPWWDGKEPTEAENACESWESYLTMLSKIGAWGSALEVSAAAVHYDRPIIVFQPRGVPEIYNGRGKGGAPIALWFSFKAL